MYNDFGENKPADSHQAIINIPTPYHPQEGETSNRRTWLKLDRSCAIYTANIPSLVPWPFLSVAGS
jgi:hypothetical protein